VASNGSSALIGISCYIEQARFRQWDVPAAVLAQTYLDCVTAGGGIPVLVPPMGRWGPAEVSRLDALVLAGGPDVDPARYGQEPDERTDRPRVQRDEAELRLLNAALETGTPVLGVCRGMQLLNIALGGTLNQHLPDDLGHTDHRPTADSYGLVDVTVSAASRLAGIIGEQVGVRCHHHQGIDRLGAGLAAVAWAGDGSVEAVERSGAGFVLGVQWHPEQDATDVRLFQALVAAAREST
jgi:putative glutamine amidotransferase